MVFVAHRASIVSGTVAERIKLWPFLILRHRPDRLHVPDSGSWKWGAGWLDGMGFHDFAGSTHGSLRRRLGRTDRCHHPRGTQGQVLADGRVMPMVGSNIPLATLGTFILWLGWFGFQRRFATCDGHDQ